MSTAQLDNVYQHLRRVVLVRDGAGMTDGQLLETFISQQDQAAFEALVRRHGSMVLRACRRVVGNHHDAEDAFQATFLILARKAASVKSREMVANWLHGVAVRTALKARTLRVKTQVRERQVTKLPDREAAQQDHCHALQPLLDQELSRLAEIYRLPILLCDLEGKSIKATAQQLGWPQGTVAGRLARGRKLLAKRLTRHGLGVSAGVVMLQNSVSACVSPALVAATVKAASAYAAGKSAAAGTVSASVAVLMEGVVKAMFWTKLKIAAVVLMVGTIIALGGEVLINGMADGQQTGAAKDGDKAVKRQAEQPKEKAGVGDKDAAVAKTDHEKLRGTWRVVEMDSHGKSDSALPGLHWSIGKDKIVMTPAFFKTTKSPVARQDASYHFWGDNNDAAPATHNINVTFQLVTTSPDENENAVTPMTYRGIFALDGDRLKLCFRQLVFGQRPTEIPASSSKDDNLLIVVLQRETAAPKTDEEKLQGDWKLIEWQENGDHIDLSKGSPTTSFVGDSMIDADDGAGVLFKLDNTKRPKQITEIYKSGNVERKIVGIYSLDGDRLKICFSRDEKATIPDNFTAVEGSGRHLQILKRVKSAVEGGALPQRQGRADANAAEPVLPKKELNKTENDAKRIEDSLWERLSFGYLDLKKANFEILVKEIKGRRLLHPTFIRRDRQGRTDFFMMADEAELKVDFANGNLLVLMSKGICVGLGDGGIDQGVFEKRTWSVPLSAIDGAP